MKIFKRYWYWALLFICLTPIVYANNLEQNTKLWGALRSKGLFAKYSAWSYLAELHARFGLNDSEFDQGLIRLGLGYHLSSALSIWGGYVYSLNDGDDRQYEQRFWQQISWRLLKQQHWQLSSRTRLEQRKLTSDPAIAWRFRQKITLQFPNYFANKVTPLFADEVFLNLNYTDWTGSRVVDQNRVIIGLLFPLFKHVSLEVAYINQYQIRSPQNIMDHILFLMFNLNP